jgi:hypothetical protein
VTSYGQPDESVRGSARGASRDTAAATRARQHPPTEAGRRRIGAGSVLAAVAILALMAVAVLVGARLFLAGQTQDVWVQFSDVNGRVQLEYCSSLPESFTGSVRNGDLGSTSPLVPVKVGPEVCANPDFPDGVWIHLHRSQVTLATMQPS